MKNTLYLYAQKSLFEIIKEILFEYTILPLTTNDINDQNFKNNNALIILKTDTTNEINKFFFLSNNIVVFLLSKQKSQNKSNLENTNYFCGRLTVKKFFDEIKTSFMFKKMVLKNIKIVGEKIFNINSGESLLLTDLEKEILTVLFENKKIKREYLLEEILKIKKNIETKTIESHITRIRRKLLSIDSEIQIKSKEDFFYLESVSK